MSIAVVSPLSLYLRPVSTILSFGQILLSVLVIALMSPSDALDTLASTKRYRHFLIILLLARITSCSEPSVSILSKSMCSYLLSGLKSSSVMACTFSFLPF